MKKSLPTRENLRLFIFSAVTGLVGGSLLEIGRILESGGTLHQFGPGNLARILICSLLLAVTCGFLLSHLAFSGAAWSVGSAQSMGEFSEQTAFQRRYFLLLWLGILLCWLPVLLAYYPTLWTYDVDTQVPALRGIAPTTHHPLLHTLYLETLVQVGSSEGHYETGMLLLSLSQMLMMSGIFAYAIEKTRTWSCRRWVRILLFLFFALFPVNSILSISMTKDVLFSGCFLICFLKLYELAENPESYFAASRRSSRTIAFYAAPHSVGRITVFLLFGVLMLSLRSNAVYVMVVLLPVGFLLSKKGFRRSFGLLLLSLLCLYGGFQTLLYHAMGAEDGEAQEAYCVPMQCLVGTALRHPELIPEDETGQLLMGIVPRDLFSEDLSDNFDPHLADPVKERWRRMDPEDFDGIALLKTWVSYGLQYPVDYADIWGTLSLGAWYPLDTTHGHIYAGQGYLLTDFKAISVMQMERPASRLPWLRDLLEKIATENVQENIPVISLLFAPATYVWVMLFCIVLALYRRQYAQLLPLALLFLYWGTVLLGPCILVRYLYPVMVTVPLLLCRLQGRPYQSR